MSLKITDLKISDLKIEKTPELDKIVKLMAAHGIQDAYHLLPKSIKKRVSFVLNNTYAAFANAVRRTLTEDIPTTCMVVDEKDIMTDDEFISGMSDVLMKNLSLVPIYQTGAVVERHKDLDVYLYVFNNTNDILDVKARDIRIVRKTSGKKGKHVVNKKGKKGGDDSADTDLLDEIQEIQEEDLTSDTTAKDTTDEKSERKTENVELCPDDNILIMRLRPGKYLKLRNIQLETGTSAKNAGKFSLLNNITYKPLDIDPYDQFTGKGTRSIEKDCKSFEITFSTCGNIEPDEVIKRMHTKLTDDLLDIKKKIDLYVAAGKPAYYSGQDCEVTVVNSVTHIKLNGHYLSELNLIAMCGYTLDENIPFITATVERFDSVVGSLHIKHADPIGVLMKSIDSCKKDLDTLLAVF